MIAPASFTSYSPEGKPHIEWRAVREFSDYAVRDDGSIVRVVPDRRNHALTGKPLIATPNHSGYPELSLCRDGRAFKVRVNRVVCEAFHGPAPSPKHHAAHLNGDRQDNRAANLAWKAPIANEADKVAHGTAPVGARHPAAKLTEEAVRSIRVDTRPQRTIAASHGVSQFVVSAIRLGKLWRHVA